MHSLLYALLEVVFPANFDSFLTGTAIYITRAPCIGDGQVGGEWGGWVAKKNFKNLAGLLVDLQRRKMPKREERMIDRMAILPMAAMPTNNMAH